MAVSPRDTKPPPTDRMTRFHVSDIMTRLFILTTLLAPILAAPVPSQPPPYLSKRPTIVHDQDLILPNQPSSLYKRCGSSSYPAPIPDSLSSLTTATAGPLMPQFQSALLSSTPGHFFDSLLSSLSRRSVPVVEDAKVDTEDCEEGTDRSPEIGGRGDEEDVFASI
ncbi:hypothetical protein KVT40_005350 [Elsinoe batatas]|uniref:Uncharacterized protein n=1 Tax=Elsinoe batatas TaxID=2601811 RepID=A0A8K0L001_9PEZI|nr:hypothetical protein KVT40_005350 [Elsinoe batatas]